MRAVAWAIFATTSGAPSSKTWLAREGPIAGTEEEVASEVGGGAGVRSSDIGSGSEEEAERG